MTTSKFRSGPLLGLFILSVVPMMAAADGCGPGSSDQNMNGWHQDDAAVPGDGAVAGDGASQDDGGSSQAMLFRVTVPENTPPEDRVVLWLEGNTPIEMTREGPRTFTANVPDSTRQQPDGTPLVVYRYTRDGFDFPGAEYLEPDTNDYFWTSYGRSTTYVPGGVQEDQVERWRWFPADGTAIVTDDPSLTTEAVTARTQGEPLHFGAYMADLFEPAFQVMFAPTAQRLQSLGFDSALLSPPWQVAQTDPLPVIENQIDDHPNYPDDMLALQIDTLVAQGISVIVQPQVHPKLADSQGRDSAWWDAWFEQVTAMHLHHAEIAEAHGALLYSFYPEGMHTGGVIPDADQRWRTFIAAIRSVFSGQVGVNVWEFSGQDGTSYLIPDISEITFLDAVDFISFQTAGQLADSPSPSDDELLADVGEQTAVVLAAAREQGIPVWLEPAYAAVQQSWRGTTFYSVNLQNAVYDGEDEWQMGRYALSGTDQARVMHAYARFAAQTPEVAGLLPFGYWPLSFPLAPDFSVRDKPAEGVLSRWAGAAAQ